MINGKEKLLSPQKLGREKESIPATHKGIDVVSGDGQIEQIRQVVEQLPEDGVDDEQGFSENGKIQPNSGTTSSARSTGGMTVAAAPSIEVMIRQTMEAVQEELKKNEKEMKFMLKNHKTPYYQINSQAQKIRFLNGILVQLGRAARLAEEFIVGLWKQYVRKV